MLMVCISTGQNITNLIPAIQFNITDILLLESETAKTNEWSKGIIQVLLNRRVKIHGPVFLSKEDNSDISKIEELIEKELPNEPIIFNLGGGQKPQIIAMWNLFNKRERDIACYADQDQDGYLQSWTKVGNKLQFESKSIDLKLTAIEIFKTFGFEIKTGYVKLYRSENLLNTENLIDLMHIKEFRELIFTLPVMTGEFINETFTKKEVADYWKENKNMLNYKIDQDFKKKIKPQEHMFKNFITSSEFQNLVYNTLSKSAFDVLTKAILSKIGPRDININTRDLLPHFPSGKITVDKASLEKLTGFNKSSSYFEKICINRMIQNLELGEHNIIEAYANLEIMKDNLNVAEYDILCVTNKGKIIAFDAKTFDFESKDIDARLYNLEKGSGYYRKFNAVIPYNINDLGKKMMPPQLERLPFKLLQKKIDFFVISDDSTDSFWIKEDNGYISTSIVRPTNNLWLECKLFKNCLKRKNILR